LTATFDNAPLFALKTWSTDEASVLHGASGMPHHQDNPGHQSSPASSSEDSPRVVVKSTEILQGKSEIWIEHGSEMYRLRLTRAGKLLLSK